MRQETVKTYNETNALIRAEKRQHEYQELCKMYREGHIRKCVNCSSISSDAISSCRYCGDKTKATQEISYEAYHRASVFVQRLFKVRSSLAIDDILAQAINNDGSIKDYQEWAVLIGESFR